MAQNRKHWLIAAAALGALAICGTAALMPDSFQEQLRFATRITARWSALWFLAAFTARPLYRVLGERWREVLRQRRYIGLGFAAAHTIHGICFVWLIAATDVTRSAAVYIGGGAGYALMFAMAATSNDAAMRALGRYWSRLHVLGAWWIWAVFTFSYSGRIYRPGTEMLGTVMTLLFVTAAILRISTISSTLRWTPAR